MIFALLFGWLAYLDKLDDGYYLGVIYAVLIELLLEIALIGAILHHSGA